MSTNSMATVLMEWLQWCITTTDYRWLSLVCQTRWLMFPRGGTKYKAGFMQNLELGLAYLLYDVLQYFSMIWTGKKVYKNEKEDFQKLNLCSYHHNRSHTISTDCSKLWMHLIRGQDAKQAMVAPSEWSQAIFSIFTMYHVSHWTWSRCYFLHKSLIAKSSVGRHSNCSCTKNSNTATYDVPSAAVLRFLDLCEQD